jgi:hypothetical protein
MVTESKLQIANTLRNIARYSLLLLGFLTFIFALLSGSERYGGGLKGIIKNSPNALPWTILLLLIYIAWKWEWIGGILITVLGLFFVYYFNLQGSHFYWGVFLLTLSIVLLGVCFILSSYLRKSTV